MMNCPPLCCPEKQDAANLANAGGPVKDEIVRKICLFRPTKTWGLGVSVSLRYQKSPPG
jgi:hypothetical protein